MDSATHGRLGLVTLSVMLQKVGNTSYRLGEVITIRQEYDSYMVRVGPIEAAPLYQQNPLLNEQVQYELLIILDRVHLRIKTWKEIHRRLRLKAGDPRDIGE